MPLRATEHAKMALVSTLASAALGTAHESTQIVGEILRARSGSHEARVWFARGEMLAVTAAARLNAMCSDAAACDDSDFRSIAHIGTAVAATALAIGERTGSTGPEVLTAIVTGYEAAGRVGEAAGDGLAARGFHPVVLCTFGASAAAARLLGLDAERTVAALALAATSASGVLAATDGWTREYQAGQAVSDGIDAAQAARAGYRAGAELVDGPRGVLATLAGEADSEALERALGGTWDIETDLGIKMRPGGYPFAAAVEAAIDAASRADVPVEEITAVRVSGPSLRVLSGPRRPRDFVEAIHSLAFYVAAGICHREFSWDAVDERHLRDPRLNHLLDIVEVVPAPAPGGYAFRWGASVTITTRSGARTQSTVDAPWGSARRGIEWADVEAKTRTLLERAGQAPAVADAILERVHALDRASSIAELVHWL